MRHTVCPFSFLANDGIPTSALCLLPLGLRRLTSVVFYFLISFAATYPSGVNDAFNYVAVLVSIVVGLAVTRVLSQISEVIQAGNRPQTYWIHTVWLVNAFSMLMLNWWVFYRWHTTPEWTFYLFVWVTLAPTLFYLASSVIAPGELAQTGSANWRDYYYDNRRGFFFILASIWPLDIIDTLLKGKQHFIDQGPLYLPTMIAWCLGCVVAGITKNERYHGFLVIFFPLYQIFYTTIVLLKLG